MRYHLAHLVPDRRLHGLYGYAELIDSIEWGLTALGHEVTRGLNRLSSRATNIVFGFQVGKEPLLDRIPPGSILYNLEQIAGLAPDALKPIYAAAAQRYVIWEYSERNLSTWERLQPAHAVVHVPIGWAPVLARIDADAEKDIDVLFYGLPGGRRLAVFEELCRAGVRTVFVCGLYGASRDNLIARAKLVLNVHLYEHSKIFEVARVSYLLANRKAVVSEAAPGTFVEADLGEAVAFAPATGLIAVCQKLLADDRARHELERRGEEIFRRRDVREILAQALETTPAGTTS